MAGQFCLQFRLPRKSQGSFTCRKSATWDRRLYFPSEGRVFFSRILCFIALVLEFQCSLYRTSLFLDCKGRLVGVIINRYWGFRANIPSPLGTSLLRHQRTPRIWPAISQLFRRELGHGKDYFTSPPKEGMRWIFPAGKIRRLRSGANPRSWVPEASMLTTRPPKPLLPGLVIT
jgi:hypothetical protein